MWLYYDLNPSDHKKGSRGSACWYGRLFCCVVRYAVTGQIALSQTNFNHPVNIWQPSQDLLIVFWYRVEETDSLVQSVELKMTSRWWESPDDRSRQSHQVSSSSPLLAHKLACICSLHKLHRFLSCPSFMSVAVITS